MLGRTITLQLHRTSLLNLLPGRFFSATSDAGAPWPWLDPAAPQVLPYYVKSAAGSREAPLSNLREAIEVIRARADANRQGSPPAIQSGRPVRLSSKEESIEFIIRVKVPKTAKSTTKNDHAIQGVLTLPHGTGQACTIGVIADGAQADAARKACANVVGADPLIDQIIAEGKKAILFDKLIVTPAFMKSVARAGRILGPKGLMPSAKVGTLTDDVAGAVKEMRRGVLTYRGDRDGNVHAIIGKALYKPEDLLVNMGALIQTLLDSRPKDLPGSDVEDYEAKASELQLDLQSELKLSQATKDELNKCNKELARLQTVKQQHERLASEEFMMVQSLIREQQQETTDTERLAQQLTAVRHNVVQLRAKGAGEK
eukprot:gene16059-22196_t